MNRNRRDVSFKSFMRDFQRIRENADEKFDFAEKLRILVKNSMKKLDREIDDFKIILEARNPGMTSSIEEKVTKSDSSVSAESVKSSTQELTEVKRPRTYTANSENSSISIKPMKPIQVLDESGNVKVKVLAMPPSRFQTPRAYCICLRPAHGKMIACDNQYCWSEWFHYDCVQLERAPEGSWYCPDCYKKFQKS